MIIGKVLNPKWMVVNLNQVKVNQARRNSLTININDHKLNLTLSSNSVIELKTIIQSHN